MVNKDQLWQKFLEKIRPTVNSEIYATWFQNTYINSIDNNKITIVTKLDLQKKWLQNRYYDFIQSNLFEISNTNYELIFKLEDEIKNEIQVDKEEKTNTSTEREDKVEVVHKSNLNKNLTFSTFVVGNSNRLAQAAALQVAQDPGKIYNPLFLFGNSGLGKTHLMHAIGNYIEQNDESKKVLYVTSQQFMDDYSKYSRKDDEYKDYFKDKYHNIDVLIIDDIQCIATGAKTQMEFFHTFNDLHSNNKQVILSSDRSPNDLKQMEDRLRTRFNWGLTAEIYPPELELRKNILKNKIKNYKDKYASLQDTSDEVIDYIASNIAEGDVRILENSLNRLMAYSAVWGLQKITLKDAVDALKDLINKGTSEQADISRIQKVVADFFQISVEDLKGRKRSSNVAFPRQIAMYLSRTLLNESFERIGLEFGGKDHSTVMHSCDKIEDECNTKEETRNTIEKIKENLI
jgi:chromosomal replication initiator protein